MPALAVVGAVSAVGGMAMQAKSLSMAKKAANGAGVDLEALDAKTREMAIRNAEGSAALEQKMTPEVVAMRRAANLSVLGNMSEDPNQKQAVSMLMGRIGQDVQSPLLNDAINKARADLSQGGLLSLDQRNEATRRAGATAGTVTGGLGLGRDIAARDLGLTSYAVEQQRLNNAANLGGMELNQNQFNAGNFMNQFNSLTGYYNQKRGLDLATAQYGESIARPVVGLDPASYANLAVGNQNVKTQAQMGVANATGAMGSSLMNFGGSMIGGYMGGMGGGGSSTVPWSQSGFAGASKSPIYNSVFGGTPTG